MKTLCKYFIIFLLVIPCIQVSCQDQEEQIDSLVNMLRTAGREWNNYSKPLIEIGEAAVPALLEAVKDRSLSLWNRRITAMTLNNIHSPQWVRPALEILFNREEDPVLRNQVTAGLRGFKLTEVKDQLWGLFKEESNEFHKSNLANLLLTSDTTMAYKSFEELYNTCDGHVQRNALLNLVRIRPHESTTWYLKAILGDDWMTSNAAMDSLITSDYFNAGKLLESYHKPGIGEEIKWCIVYIFGHRAEPESIQLLAEALQDESWLVHTEAAVGLSRFDSKKVIPEMKKL